MEKFVLVPIERYLELTKSYNKLEALEAGGVDDWEWFGEAISNYIDEHGELGIEENEIAYTIVERD